MTFNIHNSQSFLYQTSFNTYQPPIEPFDDPLFLSERDSSDHAMPFLLSSPAQRAPIHPLHLDLQAFQNQQPLTFRDLFDPGVSHTLISPPFSAETIVISDSAIEDKTVDVSESAMQGANPRSMTPQFDPKQPPQTIRFSSPTAPHTRPPASTFTLPLPAAKPQPEPQNQSYQVVGHNVGPNAQKRTREMQLVPVKPRKKPRKRQRVAIELDNNGQLIIPNLSGAKLLDYCLSIAWNYSNVDGTVQTMEKKGLVA